MTRLVRNIAYNLAGQLTLLVLGFVSARYIYAGLGKDVLGIIYFSVMLRTIVVAVLELGVTTTTVKEVSSHYAGDTAYVVRLIRSGAALYWCGYALAAIVVVAAAPSFVTRWIHLVELPPEEGARLLRILGWSAVLALPQTFYAGVFRGMQRMGVTNAIDVAMSILQHAGIIAIIKWTGDMVLVAWWIAGVAVLKTVVLVAMTAQVFGIVSLAPRIDREVIRRNKAFALPMFVVTILAMIHMQADEIVISWILPASAIGIFGVVQTSIARGSVVTAGIVQGAFPALSELAHAGERSKLLRTAEQLHDLLCHAVVPVYALLVFLALPVFSAVLDPGTASALVLPAALIALGYYLNGTLNIPYYVSLAQGRPDIAARQNVLALVFSLPATVVLTWQFGITGAAASWIWYQLFAYAYTMPRLCRECLDVPPARWFGTAAVRLLTIAATYGLTGIVVAASAPTTTMTLVLAYLAATLVFALVSWPLLGRTSRAAVIDLLRSRGRI